MSVDAVRSRDGHSRPAVLRATRRPTQAFPLTRPWSAHLGHAYDSWGYATGLSPNFPSRNATGHPEAALNVANCCSLIAYMERETGLEPATLSLGS